MRGSHQPALHHIGGQPRIRLQHERHRGAHHCRRLGGARHDVEVVDGQRERGVQSCEQRRLRIHDADDVSARRQNVRLHEPLERRPRGREGSQPPAERVARRVVVGHRADRDDVGSVAGHADRLRCGSRVARRGYDHYAGLPQLHHRLVDGVVPVERLRLRGERQVQHANVVGGPVGEDPVEPVEHGRVGRAAVGVERFHRDQPHARRDPEGLPVHRADRIGDDGGHVRAVAAAVLEGAAVGAVDDEAHVVALSVLDPGRREAAIEHRYRDSGAVEPLSREAVDTDLCAGILVGNGPGVGPAAGGAAAGGAAAGGAAAAAGVRVILRRHRSVGEQVHCPQLPQAGGLRRSEHRRHAVDDRQVVCDATANTFNDANRRLSAAGLHDIGAGRGRIRRGWLGKHRCAAGGCDGQKPAARDPSHNGRTQ